MLSEVIKSVILLAFLFGLILEVVILFAILQHDLYSEEKPKNAVKKTLNPRKIIRKRQEERKKEKEIKRYETLMSNIDVYDGTEFGQKDLD